MDLDAFTSVKRGLLQIFKSNFFSKWYVSFNQEFTQTPPVSITQQVIAHVPLVL